MNLLLIVAAQIWHSGADCGFQIQACNLETQRAIGGTVECDKCVCAQNDPSDKNCQDPSNTVCEVTEGFDGNKAYNCAKPPDALACVDSILACDGKVGRKYTPCDNCVCRIEVGTSCSVTADCLVTELSSSINDTEKAYECVANKCGDKIVECFSKMNENPNNMVDCDECVCETSRHQCVGGSSCQMACHDRKGCYDFSNSALLYGCQSTKNSGAKSDTGTIAGICLAVAALTALCLTGYYYA
jgi:hypothetical protein